jgi:predicted nucleic acid-binding protein
VGALALPTYGEIYLDANSVIYTIERIDPYLTILNPLWDAVQARTLTITTSDLTLLEVLVAPLKRGDREDAAFKKVTGLPVAVLSELTSLP